MLSMGDELGRTQHGNNNAYAQDGALSWIDWAGADRDLVAFVGRLVRLRRAHRALRDERWLSGEPADASGIPDVEWRRPDGRDMSREDWEHPHGRSLVAVFYARPEADGPADRVAVAFHAGSEEVEIRWPDARDGFRWRRALDTSRDGGVPEPGGDDARVAPRSVLILVEEAGKAPRPHTTGVEPAVLDRLAQAAGIAPEWHEVGGTHHRVGDDTRLALLEAMGWGVASTSQARERLAAIAQARECRRLPVALVRHEDEPLRVPLAPGGPSCRAMLVVTAEDGATRRIAIDTQACAAERVVAADGRTVARRLVPLPPLPPGCYRVGFEDEAAACDLLVAPRRCHLPPALEGGRRRFGLAAHLYTLRRPGDQGIGDFTALAQAAQATARVGGALAGLNPLHALFAGERGRASPYHPSDRRFLDPIYVDVTAVPEFAHSPGAREAFARAPFERLAAGAGIDHPGVWAAKRAVLEACFEAFVRRPSADPLAAEFGRFVAGRGEALRRFATFEAIAAERPGVPWQRWPDELRRPDGPGVARFAARHARELDFAAYLQWLADRGLAQAAAAGGLEIGFYRDLAIGAAPDGAEAWATQSALARGVSIGAPADPFCAEGQVWNLPPPLPEAMAAGGFEGFRALIAANARHAGALRIDHVMGISRLFWVPDGASAHEGAYVRYPFGELLGALALESRRARCLVVGEDLGTVPAGLRERLEAAAVLSYRVLWFERDGPEFRPPGRYPALAAACVSTHDLPTIRGWWSGADIDERRALGLADEAQSASAHAARGEDKAHLSRALGHAGLAPPASPDVPEEEAVAQALHRFVGATPSLLALVQADDLAGETSAVNLPGTDRERPNWRRRLGVDAADLWDTPVGLRAAADLAPMRGADVPKGNGERE
jgi:glycogen operon protein